MEYSTPNYLKLFEKSSNVFLDMTASVQLEAGLNMGRTIFICIILGFGAMLFSRDGAAPVVFEPLLEYCCLPSI